jgi:hypothetical protein
VSTDFWPTEGLLSGFTTFLTRSFFSSSYLLTPVLGLVTFTGATLEAGLSATGFVIAIKSNDS